MLAWEDRLFCFVLVLFLFGKLLPVAALVRGISRRVSSTTCNVRHEAGYLESLGVDTAPLLLCLILLGLFRSFTRS